MKLASLKQGGRDGTLVVVSRDLTRAVVADGIARTLQQALEDWSNLAPRLNALSEALNEGRAAGAFALDVHALAGEGELARLERSPHPCRAPSNLSMAAPICRMSPACARRVVRKCRHRSTPIR